VFLVPDREEEHVSAFACGSSWGLRRGADPISAVPRRTEFFKYEMASTISLERPGVRSNLSQRPSVDITIREPLVKILMVDDQPSNLLALQAVLEDLGHVLVKAHSGDEALKCLLRDDFAVILMDVFMPGIDGFETAELIRQRERSRSTPIVFMTAIGKSDTHISRGYSVGAVDYLFKPIVPEILQAKVLAFVDLFLKTAMITQQAEQLRELERERNQAQLEEAQRQLRVERHQQDARAARKVQQLLFPHKPPFCPGFDIAGASYPADDTGGDYFDYIPNPEGLLDAVIGDVSGHGFSAALLMSSTRAYLRALALSNRRIEDVVSFANRAVADDMELSRFVTLLYTRLAGDSRLLSYINAGHPPGYVITSCGDIRAVLESTTMPLGIMTDIQSLNCPHVDLRSGDTVFLYTDGVTEAMAPDETPFGIDRALQVLRDNHARSAKEVVEALHRAVNDFVQRHVLEDDVTTIVIKVA
jgi:serine phosphatase RsbU (regulator of sigma subunit)